MDNVSTQQPTEKVNPFDPERFKVRQDFLVTGGAKKELTVVRVGKPQKHWFVRVHPDESYRTTVYLLDLKDTLDDKPYIVTPDIAFELGDFVQERQLFTSVNRQKTIFLWTVKLPDSEGKLDDWNRSASEAANLAINKWVQVRSNREAGHYDVFTASGALSDPEWGDLPPFHKLLEIAFRGQIIESIDHPVVKALFGEV